MARNNNKSEILRELPRGHDPDVCLCTSVCLCECWCMLVRKSPESCLFFEPYHLSDIPVVRAKSRISICQGSHSVSISFVLNFSPFFYLSLTCIFLFGHFIQVSLVRTLSISFYILLPLCFIFTSLKEIAMKQQ